MPTTMTQTPGTTDSPQEVGEPATEHDDATAVPEDAPPDPANDPSDSPTDDPSPDEESGPDQDLLASVTSSTRFGDEVEVRMDGRVRGAATSWTRWPRAHAP